MTPTSLIGVFERMVVSGHTPTDEKVVQRLSNAGDADIRVNWFRRGP